MPSLAGRGSAVIVPPRVARLTGRVSRGHGSGPDRDPVVGFLPHHGAPPAQRDLRQSIWVVSSRRPAPDLAPSDRVLPLSGSHHHHRDELSRRCSLEVFSGVLRRSKPYLRRLRHRVRALGCRSGVLRAEGVRFRSQALPQLSRLAARLARVFQLRRLRRPRHRWPARLRARRRPSRPRVLRGHLLEVRQRRTGPIPAAPGQAGLLLRLLPRGPGRLTADHGRRVGGASAQPIEAIEDQVEPECELDVVVAWPKDAHMADRLSELGDARVAVGHGTGSDRVRCG